MISLLEILFGDNNLRSKQTLAAVGSERGGNERGGSERALLSSAYTAAGGPSLGVSCQPLAAVLRSQPVCLSCVCTTGQQKGACES